MSKSGLRENRAEAIRTPSENEGIGATGSGGGVFVLDAYGALVGSLSGTSSAAGGDGMTTVPGRLAGLP